MRLLIPVIGVATIVLFTSACAAFMPGSGVNQNFAARWGCNATEVLERAETLKARLPSGRQYIPQVGWTACELMARNGRPQGSDLQSIATRRSASWWYRSSNDTHLVSLDLQSNGWVVTYVGW